MIAASVKIDHAELDRLAAQFGKASGAYVKVGILGDSSRGTNPHKNRRWLSKPIWARGAEPEKTGWSHGFEARNASGQIVRILPGYLSNAEIGRKIAFENAKQKIWPLMGYELKQRLYQATLPSQSPI